MKICPTCNEVYNDDDINFCLADGTTLLKKRGKAAKHSHWNDVVAIILAAVAVLVFLCLVTSSPNDRSFISTGNGSTSTQLDRPGRSEYRGRFDKRSSAGRRIFFPFLLSSSLGVFSEQILSYPVPFGSQVLSFSRLRWPG